MPLPTIPALTSLTDLITGTVTDDFKKLFRASSLVAAAIFVALNLVLVLPPLRQARSAPVVALEGLATAWQIALGTLFLFSLAYVLQSLEGAFLSLASGTGLRNSPLIGRVLLFLQRRTHERLEPPWTQLLKGCKDEEIEQVKSMATYRLAYDFASQDALAPTRLGNVLASAAGYAKHKYGAHLNTLWPFMEMVLREKDTDLHDQVRRDQEALDFLTTVWALLIVVSLELIVLRLVLGPPLQALWALVLWIAAYAVYGAAVQKGRDWGRGIRTTFDLYLSEIAGKLKLGTLDKEQWKEVCAWLAYGGIEEDTSKAWNLGPHKAWYPAKKYEPPVQHPPTVKVEAQVVTPFQTEFVLQEDKKKGEWTQSAGYVYGITNAATGEHARPAGGVFVTVTDARFLGVPESVDGWRISPGFSYPAATPGRVKVKGERLHDSNSLLWDIGRLQPNSSRVLRYRVCSPYVTAQVNHDGFEIRALSYQENDEGVSIRIELENLQATASATGTTVLEVSVHVPYCKALPRLGQHMVDNGNLQDIPETGFQVSKREKLVSCTIEVPETAEEVTIVMV